LAEDNNLGWVAPVEDFESLNKTLVKFRKRGENFSSELMKKRHF